MPHGKRIRRIALIEAQKFWAFDLPGLDVQVPHDAVQPLGLVILAAVARQRDPGVELRIFDLRLLRDDLEALCRGLSEFGPDVIGFRGTSKNGLFLNDAVRYVRERFPDAILVAGGPHLTALKGQVLEEAPLDFGVYGEGELTLVDLLNHIEDGGGYGEVPGLIYRGEEGTVIVNPPREYIQDLDSLPLPAWDLIDQEKYFELYYFPNTPVYHNARREICFIFTSRACPYKCTFCHNIFGKKFRAQSPEKVLSEMEYLYNVQGVRQFSFADDVFNWDRERVHRICDLIIERGLDVKMDFPNGLRGDIMDESLILKMRSAGMFCCTYALETASPRLQKLVKKNVKIDKLREVIRFTSAQDVIIRLNVILGFPTETKEEMISSLEYGLDPAVDLLFIHSFNPFEGTEIAGDLHSKNIEFDEFRDKYNFYKVSFSVCDVPASEIQELIDDYTQRFFTLERFTRLRQKLRSHLASVTG